MAERDEDHLVLHGEARAGRVLKGEVRLAQSREGAAYKVALVCTHHTPRSDWSEENEHYEKLEVLARRDRDGWFLPFEFDIPVSTPASGRAEPLVGFVADDSYEWEVCVAERRFFARRRDYKIDVGPALFAEILAAEERLPLEARRQIEDIADRVDDAGGHVGGHLRARLARMSDTDRQAAKVWLPVAAFSMKWSVIGALVLAALGIVSAILERVFE
jgi:hypothetical protein